MFRTSQGLILTNLDTYKTVPNIYYIQRISVIQVVDKKSDVDVRFKHMYRVRYHIKHSTD